MPTNLICSSTHIFNPTSNLLIRKHNFHRFACQTSEESENDWCRQEGTRSRRHIRSSCIWAVWTTNSMLGGFPPWPSGQNSRVIFNANKYLWIMIIMKFYVSPLADKGSQHKNSNGGIFTQPNNKYFQSLSKEDFLLGILFSYHTWSVIDNFWSKNRVSRLKKH